jgi:hypothetical protein
LARPPLSLQAFSVLPLLVRTGRADHHSACMPSVFCPCQSALVGPTTTQPAAFDLVNLYFLEKLLTHFIFCHFSED